MLLSEFICIFTHTNISLDLIFHLYFPRRMNFPPWIFLHDMNFPPWSKGYSEMSCTIFEPHIKSSRGFNKASYSVASCISFRHTDLWDKNFFVAQASFASSGFATSGTHQQSGKHGKGWDNQDFIPKPWCWKNILYYLKRCSYNILVTWNSPSPNHRMA